MDFALSLFALLASASTQNKSALFWTETQNAILKNELELFNTSPFFWRSEMLIFQAHDGPQFGTFLCRTWS
jgi:hypothetical protein